MKTNLKIFAYLICLISFSASAKLVITPTQLVFEERDRTKEVIIINPTDTVQSYVLDWNEFKQTNTGAYLALTEDEKADFAAASDHLRFTPARVTLRPGQKQTVKVVLRRNKDMTNQEYRSHLKFAALPPEASINSNDNASGISFNIDLLVSYTIPVIVRTDNAPLDDVKIEEAKIVLSNNHSPKVHTALSKPVGRSVLGGYEVYFKGNNQQEYTLAGKLNGVNAFHEINEIKTEIDWLIEQKPRQGVLKIVFKSRDLKDGSVEYVLKV